VVVVEVGWWGVGPGVVVDWMVMIEKLSQEREGRRDCWGVLAAGNRGGADGRGRKTGRLENGRFVRWREAPLGKPMLDRPVWRVW